MKIAQALQKLIQQLNQELNKTEQKAYEGINLVRPLLDKFSDNLLLMRYFAYFNNILLFVDITSKLEKLS